VIVIFLTSCSTETRLSIEQAESKAIEFLEQDESISEITINTFELYQEREGKKVYKVFSYSTKRGRLRNKEIGEIPFL
jgi:hypothetical protein